MRIQTKTRCFAYKVTVYFVAVVFFTRRYIKLSYNRYKIKKDTDDTQMFRTHVAVRFVTVVFFM